MKNFIIFLLVFAIFTNNFAFANEVSDKPKIDYPAYYGSKKCEITEESPFKTSIPMYEFGDTSAFSFSYNKDNSITITKNGEIYKKGVWVVIAVMKNKIIYEIRDEKTEKIAIYENENKIAEREEWFMMRGDIFAYSEADDIYVMSFWEKFIENGKIVETPSFFGYEEYFSRDKKSKVVLKTVAHPEYKGEGIRNIYFNGEKIYDFLNYWNEDAFTIADNEKRFAIAGSSWQDSRYMNWMITEKWFQEVKHNFVALEFSPSGRDLYAVSRNNNPLHPDATEKISHFTLFKNNEKILDFSADVYDHTLEIIFSDEENYTLRATNWDDYFIIKNGKIVQDANSVVQNKADFYDSLGRHFVVTKNKETGTETLEIDGKKIFEGNRVDERYLVGGAVFAVERLPESKSSQYYTFIEDKNDNYFLLVNGFKIEDFYDYFTSSDDLNEFYFAGNHGSVVCRDISHIHNFSELNDFFINILTKIRDASNEKKDFIKKLLDENIGKYEQNSLGYDILKAVESATRVHNK